MSTMTERLVARAITASFFNLGDPILYGKYKNKRGIIKEFGKDKHGNPTIVIEPVPKGRKKDKEMGLFKIWHDPPPDQWEDEDTVTASSPGDEEDEDGDPMGCIQ